MSVPAVSVVMSVWDGAVYLPAALDSILGQQPGDLELLVVDDGSADATPAILAGYADRDARLRVLTNPTNLGLTRSLNLALAQTRGRFIARHDADDVSRPGRLAQQVAFLQASPSVGVVGCWVESGADADAPTDLWRTPERPSEVRFELLFGNCLAHPSVMVRRDLLAAGPLYDETARYAQDFALWHRLAAATDLANLPATLYFRRVHAGMIGARHSVAQEKTVREVLNRRWTALLGHSIETAELQAVRRLERSEAPTRDDVRRAAQLLPRLWIAFRREQSDLCAADVNLLRRRLARRLLRLAVRGGRTAPAPALLAAFRSLSYDPLAPWRAIRTQ